MRWTYRYIVSVVQKAAAFGLGDTLSVLEEEATIPVAHALELEVQGDALVNGVEFAIPAGRLSFRDWPQDEHLLWATLCSSKGLDD